MVVLSVFVLFFKVLNSKFILGILTSIHNLKALFEDLQEEGFSYILTNRLSQDGLENFFSVVEQWVVLTQILQLLNLLVGSGKCCKFILT